ncbi:MAG: AAA family ATPase [Chloroflexi bacterium]|nr:AAA family ATPase [Chloroflexota bacterium]
MTTTIALAGKGGVGKTTVAAMVIKYLALNKQGAVLAIDADPSSNLNMVLGLELGWTVGDIREDMLTKVKESLKVGGAAMGAMRGGMSKRDHLTYEVQAALAESPRVDLIAMGRSEGPGCYCAVNHNLREVVDGISNSYEYVVIDNEAGMEHLSRRTTRNVQHLLIVSDPTQRGLAAAERIAGFRHELDIEIENAYLILNRVSGHAPTELLERIGKMDIEFLGGIPEDAEIGEYDLGGIPLVDLSEDSTTYRAVAAMMARVILEE